ncbi:MAG TPA: alpha/beta fold hydrolase [Pseudonocardiaceae bacterium]|nr:alpha/beta fold hydrolase [Pseudonocardiaceae bacterium]
MGEANDIVINGVRLVYDIAGEPDAPPMVLLHALGDSRADWAPVLARFAARYRVYAVDLRGHGDSDRPGEYTFGAMCADTVGLLDALGLTDVVLVGHSMGGVVTYRVAVARPDLVARIVIEDAPPPYHRDRPVPDRPDGPLAFDWAVVPAIAGAVSAGDPELWAALATITAPTLIIAGGPESHVPQDLLADVAGRIPHATLRTIPAGHNVHAARPHEFAHAVFDWATTNCQTG